MIVQIKDFSNYFIDIKKGQVFSNSERPGYMKNQLDKDGYNQILATRNDGKRVHLKIHRLIAEAVIPNPDKLPMVCHLDDNKFNNEVNNLYWGDNSSNMKDRTKNGYINNQSPKRRKEWQNKQS